MARQTRERILDGAAAAIARHGLVKLEMSDVSASSGVSRGTLYRYFPNRDVLLAELARREGLRFKQRMLAAIEEAQPGPERVHVALEHVTRHVREHAALQRLVDTDPGFVLRRLRERFASLKQEFGAVLAPVLREVELVRRRIVTADQLVDWMMRLMVSAFLLPHPNPAEMADGLTAVCRILTADLRAATRAHPTIRARGAIGARRSTRQKMVTRGSGAPAVGRRRGKSAT
jgi:AcrR family transcriptional regulator